MFSFVKKCFVGKCFVNKCFLLKNVFPGKEYFPIFEEGQIGLVFSKRSKRRRSN
jgi:hypothetical protein